MENNIDYRMLPPGRERRLLYSQSRQSNPTNISNHQNQTRHRQRLTERLEQQAEGYRFAFSRLELNYTDSPLIEHDYFSYENLSLLESVKTYLISPKLLQHSIVNIDKTNSFCVICQDTCTNTIVRVLSCKHTFHINCIDTWFTENKICPLCKFEF